MSIETTLQQIYDLPLSNLIRENVNAFPVIESLHVLAVALVFGTILIVDLRLLGVAAHRPGVRRLIAELLPFTWAAFAQTVLLLTIAYYAVACLLFYRKEMLRFLRRRR